MQLCNICNQGYELIVACFHQAIEITNYKLKILEYVESRMSLIAPNLSLIVGPTVAAKLMGKRMYSQLRNCSLIVE